MKRKLIILFLFAAVFSLTGCVMEAPEFVSLTVQVSGQGSTTPALGSNQYEKGALVILEAQPAPGWQFSHWVGEVAESWSQETTIVVDGHQSVTAYFSPIEDTEIMEAPGGLITWRANGTRVPARPNGEADIEYIMIHAMSDAAANPTDPYRIERMRAIFDDYSVESHYVIDRRGQIFQFVEDVLAGRHAGSGSWQGNPRYRNNMNRYAVGIEVMGIGTDAEMIPVIGSIANSKIKQSDRGYTDAQYDALERLINLLRERHQISEDNILGHDDYDPQRKWDPGVLFDWTRL